MSKQFWVMLAVVAVVLGGIFVVTNKKNANAPAVNSTAAVTKHIEGNGKSGVTLQEYGDFQCPVCGVFYPITKQIVDTYKDQIYYQFSHLPLTQLHPNAFAASRAAEAAGLQGKFFEMHGLLYQNQATWSQASNAQSAFNAYAEQLGLNMTQFKSDYDLSLIHI